MEAKREMEEGEEEERGGGGGERGGGNRCERRTRMRPRWRR